MKYLDFIVQTIILLTGLTMVITGIRQGNPLVGVIYAQLLLGPWQYVSSLISVVARGPAFNHKLRHLFLSTVYLLVWVSLGRSTLQFNGTMPIAFLTIIPWALGIYYYIISFKLVRGARRSKSSFLPHVNF